MVDLNINLSLCSFFRIQFWVLISIGLYECERRLESSKNFEDMKLTAEYSKAQHVRKIYNTGGKEKLTRSDKNARNNRG